jgi:phosphate transport system substrate-binding protein
MKKLIAVAAVALVGLAGLAAQTVELTGAGATFPQPLYQKMFDAYVKTAKVNYQGNGSGAGIQALTAKTVDFGASDAPMNADEQTKAGAEVLHIPTCVGAIAITYNVAGLTAPLKLSGPVLADIYLGKVDNWNDKPIADLNPGVKLPGDKIVVIRRSDGSGTSYNFTGFLSKVSEDWKTAVGQNKAPKWPVGAGGKGNAGVAAYVKQVPGSIGYVEIAFARQNKMPVALIQNKAGNFIDPNSLGALAKAADIAFPADGKADIINTDAKDGYPIAAATWLLVYKDQSYTKNAAKSKAVADLIWWMVHDGQKLNEAADYGTLPAAAVTVAETLLKSLSFDGKPLLAK